MNPMSGLWVWSGMPRCLGWETSHAVIVPMFSPGFAFAVDLSKLNSVNPWNRIRALIESPGQRGWCAVIPRTLRIDGRVRRFCIQIKRAGDGLGPSATEQLEGC